MILVIGFLLSVGSPFIHPAIVHSGAVEPQRRPQTRRSAKLAVAKPRINYSEFSHDTHVTTQKLACDSCHKFPTKNWKDVRKVDAAFPDVAEFPEHSACLECHRTQFFARERPAPAICSSCHLKATPKDTTRFLFPSLGDVTDSTLATRESISEFRVGFPHDKHLDVVGMNQPGSGNDKVRFVNASWSRQKPADQSKTCSLCHQAYQPQGSSSEEYVTKPPKNLGDNFWLKKGTFQTAPNSHTGCFVCHNADSGIAPEPKDCQACHKLSPTTQKVIVDFDPKLAAGMGIVDKTILQKWGRRISAGAFRHEGGEHPNLGCVSCHNVTVMNTVDPATLKVPIRSCGGTDGCHITATADDGGILNFEIDQKKTTAGFVCTKCHITFGKEALPANHPEAIPKPKAIQTPQAIPTPKAK
ncbi:MAG: cytochrome c3 family protein [Pyrinomonadaceae bacterium]